MSLFPLFPDFQSHGSIGSYHPVISDPYTRGKRTKFKFEFKKKSSGVRFNALRNSHTERAGLGATNQSSPYKNWECYNDCVFAALNSQTLSHRKAFRLFCLLDWVMPGIRSSLNGFPLSTCWLKAPVKVLLWSIISPDGVPSESISIEPFQTV